MTQGSSTGAKEVGGSAGGTSTRRRGSLPPARTWGLAALAGVVSLCAAAVSLRLATTPLQVPFGRNDAVMMYLLTSTMIRFGWFTWNPDIGYPHGMDFAHFPSTEIHQWLLLRVITEFTSDPILALNMFFLIGFFTVGASAYLLFAPTVGVEWLALVLAVSAATIPWHFSRFPHTLLADYSPVAIALLLAFLMWSHWWQQSGARFALALAAAVYVGTGGVYYSFYACLFIGPVLAWRVLASRSPRLWWRDAAITATVPVTMGLSAFAHSALAVTPAAGLSFVRDPLESMAFAGNPISLIIPWPLRNLRTEGEARFSVIAAVAVLVALGILVGLALAGRKGGVSNEWARAAGELTPWFRLLAWGLLWFLPGLGWAFAVLVTPNLRSWGRISVAVMFIAMVIFGIVVRELVKGRRRSQVIAAGALGSILILQVAQDHRPLMAPWAEAFDAQVRVYASALAEIIPPGCPILQIPTIRFPESWPAPSPLMGPYDHMWLPVYAPEYRWSFGVVAGSEPFAASRARYNEDQPLDVQVANAMEDGYCAIHVDEAGLTQDELAEVATLLGQPDLHEGRWALYRLSRR